VELAACLAVTVSDLLGELVHPWHINLCQREQFLLRDDWDLLLYLSVAWPVLEVGRAGYTSIVVAHKVL
jgi:hypothetical protein